MTNTLNSPAPFQMEPPKVGGIQKRESQAEPLPFDLELTLRLVAARVGFLDHLLQDWQGPSISTALDVGTGIGSFASHLAGEHRMDVTGIDARLSNVQEAGRRHPSIRFLVGDVEDSQIVSIGCFDLVAAFGLLYHLENPVRAVRHLAQMCKHLLVVESMISPGRLPRAQMLDEPLGDDQGMSSLVFHLTESGLAKLLYRAGMSHVYRPVERVNDPQFRGRFVKRPLRTILVASRTPITIPWLRELVEAPYIADGAYSFRSPFREVLRKLLNYRRKRQAR